MECLVSINCLVPFGEIKTSVPVLYSMVIVALWAWTDIEIKKIQPYIDLVHGNATPEKSLLLDYTRPKFVVF